MSNTCCHPSRIVQIIGRRNITHVTRRQFRWPQKQECCQSAWPWSGVNGTDSTFVSASGSGVARSVIFKNDIPGFLCRTSKSSQSYVSLGRQYCTTSQDKKTWREGQTSENTYDAEEVEKFSRLAQHWWDEGGEFGALHSLNALRVPLVRDGLAQNGDFCGENATTHFRPLEGVKILDIGCGGGILSEPLARLGAHVTGVDASSENVSIAEQHAQYDPDIQGRLTYRCCLVEDLAKEQGAIYDGVVASEIIEHVGNTSAFVRACSQLLRPGGSLFLTTINKTVPAYVLGIVAAERIARIVPAGSHDWNKFVRPDDLSDMLSENGLVTRLVHGMCLNPLNLRWAWTADTSINYALHALKPEGATEETTWSDAAATGNISS